jgi:3-methylcrotonyl-CoA carboxylase beta subunit
MAELVADLRAQADRVRQGGGEVARQRHLSRGKLLPRDRIRALIDPVSPFLEIGQLAAHGMYGGEVPSAGLIAGIGRVMGRECMIVANDATVKGGTYFPLTVKKHLRAQEIAEQNRLPCIYLVDSGGANLPNQDEVFPDRDHFGRIFFNQANMSAKGIAQVAVVMGSCTAGGAYVPAMSDESVIVRNQGTIFLGGPPLVKAATGEVVTAEELGGGELHSRTSGVTDHLAENDPHALGIARRIVASLNREKRPEVALREPRPPRFDPAEMGAIIPTDRRKPFEVREVIARIVDGASSTSSSACMDRRSSAASPTSGAILSASSRTTASCSASPRRRARISSSCARSAACRWCSCRTSPASWSAASTRPAASRRTGRRWSPPSPRSRAQVHGHHRRLLRRGQLRHVRPRLLAAFLWTWPNARISVMGGEQAASVLATLRRDAVRRRAAPGARRRKPPSRRPSATSTRRRATPYYATARLWDDGIIDPADTRDVLGLSIAASLNAPIGRTRFGVFRM